MATPLEHSHLGPSSWDRWVRCTRSVKQSEGKPDTAGFEAAEGTVFHELVGDCLIHGLEPESFVDGVQGLHQDGFYIRYDEEMCESAKEGLAYVRSKAAEPGWQLFVERRLDISPYTLPGQFGTGDVILINVEERWIIIFDWKYGMVPVYATENYQTSGYALGTWTTIAGELFDWDPSDIKVSLIIEQPRVPGAGGQWDTTMQRLLEFGKYTKRQAVLTQSDNAPFNPGEKQCAWCRGKDDCDAYAQYNAEILDLELDDLDVHYEEGSMPALMPVHSITPERRTLILKMRPQLNKWLDALHNAAYREADAGQAVPGMKMVEGRRGARKWKGNQKHKVEQILRDALNAKAFEPSKMISPTAAEKALGKERYAELVEGFVTQAPPHPILVPEENTKPAIENVEDLLIDLDEDEYMELI